MGINRQGSSFSGAGLLDRVKKSLPWRARVGMVSIEEGAKPLLLADHDSSSGNPDRI